MPLKKHLKRLKGEFKQLGLGFSNASSTLLPNEARTSDSPAARAVSQARTPTSPSTASISSALAQPQTNFKSPEETALQQVTLPSASSLPNATPSGNLLLTSSAPTDSASAPVASEEAGKSINKAAWAGLKTLLKVLESSAEAFGPLKSATSLLNDCIETYERAAQGRKEFEELQIMLDSLLSDLGEFFGGPMSLTMTTSMSNLCIGINKELKLVEAKRDRSRTQRYLEAATDSDEVLGCYRRIHDYLDRLKLNANLSTWKVVDEQATEARLKDLSPAHSAVYNSAKSETIGRGPCTPGTREREITKLLGWARSDQAGDVYWMNGMAGTGKTTIAYSLCADLDKSAQLGASFFCSRSLPECRKAETILPAIAYQLARFSRPFRCALSRILEADPDAHHRVLKKQFESLISKPLLEVKHAFPTDIVVVIDALDECENEHSIGQILDVLLVNSPSDLPIRFLVSSRPEPEIYRRMMNQVGASSNERLVLHELDAVTVNHDIGTYLEEELKEVPLMGSQLAALIEHSGVLFIYAATAARYIKDGVAQDDHEDRLNMILGLMPASPDGKNRDIDQLYSTILEAALTRRTLDEFGRKRMRMILDTVICMQEPMTAGALAGLLELKSGKQVALLLGPLGSVVNIAKGTELVATLHASFPDFMLDRQRSAEFHCDARSVHRRLVQACFELIRTNSPQFNICGLETSYCFDDDVPGLIERVDLAISPQLFYACRYWASHLELCEQYVNIADMLYDFLSMRLLLWMEVLNLKKSMYLGAGIVQHAEQCSRTYGGSNETIKLVHDAWRFVTMFSSHAVSRSTPHIYVSMLSLWPESEPIAVHYMQRMRGVISPQGPAMKRRQVSLLATWSFDTAPSTACYSPDGTQIAAGVGSEAFIIDGTTGKTIVGPLKGHTSDINSICFSPDGTFIASGSHDTSIRVWTTKSGDTAVGPLEGHTSRVRSICFSPEGTRIASSSDDRTIRLWYAQSGKPVRGPLEGHTHSVLSVCFSPDGARVVSGSCDNTIRVWDVQSGNTVIGPLEGHTHWVSSVHFSPNGISIVSGSLDGTIRVWGARSGEACMSPLQGHTDMVYSVCFSPDSTRIVSGSRDKTIRVWNATSGEMVISPLEGHTSMISSVRFSPDGTRMVSSSKDNTIRVWDAQTSEKPISLLEGHTSRVRSVGFSSEGTRIVSGSDDCTIRVWNAQSGEPIIGPLEGHTHWVASVGFSPDNKRIVSGSWDHTLRVWNAQSGDMLIGPLQGHNHYVTSVSFSPDGAYIVSGSADRTIRVWSAQSGETAIGPLEGHTDWITSVYFSPDGMRIVSGSRDRTVRVWEVQSGEMIIGPIQGHANVVESVAFSPDGTHLVSGCRDGLIRVWDVDSGIPLIGSLEGHTDGIKSVRFSPNGSNILSGSKDGTIRIWDIRTGGMIMGPLEGHTDSVNSLSLSPDGRYVASGSNDCTIRVWDVGVRDGGGDPKGAAPWSHPSDIYSPLIPALPDVAAQNNEPVSAYSTYHFWDLSDDGWVINSQSRLLAWVPPDLQDILLRPRNIILMNTRGSCKLEFDFAKMGESWFECYEPPSC